MRFRKISFISVFVLICLCSAGIFQSALYAAQVTPQGISLTVNNASDSNDLNPGDSICDTDGGIAGSQCSLRAAIQEANAIVGTDTINFNIQGNGVQTIATLSALPKVTDSVTIDGYSQPGSTTATNLVSATILIKIQMKAPLEITASNSRIKGLEIVGQNYSSLETGPGIYINGASNNVIEGNLIEQNSQGVAISNVANNNIIGGTTPAARNVISGNGSFLSRYTACGVIVSGGSGNIVEGNYITGNLVGVVASADVTIGGTSPGARNVISGNAHEGGPDYSRCGCHSG